MLSDTSATGDHVSLLIKQLDLPEEEQRRKALLEDLEAAVEAVLDDHGLEADRLQTIGGHTYSMVNADCPECGDRLKLIEPRLDTNNGAFARASCECGWRGDATYRLIDLQPAHSHSEDDDDTEDSESVLEVFEQPSGVRQSKIEPTYTPY